MSYQSHASLVACVVLASALLTSANPATAGGDRSWGDQPNGGGAVDLYVVEQNASPPVVQVVRTDEHGIRKKTVASYSVGSIAYPAVASPDYKYVWVHNGGDGTISIISTVYKNVRTITTATAGEGICFQNGFTPPCTYPGVMVFDPSGKKAYVSDAGDNTLKLLDTYTGAILKSAPVGNFPAGIAISPDGSRLYVTNLIDNTVTVIRTAGLGVLTTIQLPPSTWHGQNPCTDGSTPSGPSPTGVEVSPDGQWVYVTNAYDSDLLPSCAPFQPSTVTVIRTRDNAVVNAPRPIPSGGFVATAISFAPNSNVALVANTGTDAIPDNRIGVIDTSSQSLARVIVEPAPSVGPAEVDPWRKLIYVPSLGTGSGGESILTLDGQSLAPINVFTLPAGSFPLTLAVVPLDSN